MRSIYMIFFCIRTASSWRRSCCSSARLSYNGSISSGNLSRCENGSRFCEPSELSEPSAGRIVDAAVDACVDVCGDILTLRQARTHAYMTRTHAHITPLSLARSLSDTPTLSFSCATHTHTHTHTHTLIHHSRGHVLHRFFQPFQPRLLPAARCVSHNLGHKGKIFVGPPGTCPRMD